MSGLTFGNNDEEDSVLGTSINPTMQIPINVHVVQYLGEELVEYVPEPDPEPEPEPEPDPIIDNNTIEP